MSTISILRGDLSDEDHARAVVELLDHYAGTLEGGGAALTDDVRQNLIPRLRQETNCHLFLALSGARAIGLAVCFRGFSSFRAAPLMNIHDLVVHEQFRGRGVGRRLLETIDAAARELGCCRLTLEVREDNHRARDLYRRFGFDPGEAGSSAISFFMKRFYD